MPTPHHRFTIHSQHTHLHLAAEATLAAPWTILFGASGSGKTTILRALAGLTPSFRTTFERANDPAWTPLQDLPPEHRDLAYAPQGAPLLPHLSVLENVRFPEKLRPDGKPSHLPEILCLLQLQTLLTKRPHQLSGGERQRVSLARALAVPGARLLLLDEPFAGLDRHFRDAILPGLQAHLQARALPVLSVTHDPDEALLLQAEVLQLQDGRFIAQGPAPRVLAPEIERLRKLLITAG